MYVFRDKTIQFKGNGIIEFTRSLGVEFGSDLNAYTSIDQTVYRVCDVPTKRATALDSCLLILKDWSNGLLLEPEEIDKERDVVHNEWRLGEGPSQRMIQRALPKVYPGSKYGVRLPIGLMSVIDRTASSPRPSVPTIRSGIVPTTRPSSWWVMWT